MLFFYIANRLPTASAKHVQFIITYAIRDKGKLSLTNASIPIMRADTPIVMSTRAIKISISLSERYPQQTPLLKGIQLQNLGSLS